MKTERQIENEFIKKLIDLKYVYREDIRDKFSLEENFRKHFEMLNRVKLSDSEFIRLRDSIINSNVFETAKKLREINTFKRDDDTPLQYTLVNLKNWCKNEFEVVNQLRINTENSNHRYDVILLINGIPVVQIELKTLQITPKKAMEQIVNYKMIREMDIQILFFVLFSFLLLVMKLIPIIFPIIARSILHLMQMRDSCLFMNLQIRTIIK